MLGEAPVCSVSKWTPTLAGSHLAEAPQRGMTACSLPSSHDDRAGYDGLDLGAAPALPRVRPGYPELCSRGGRLDDTGQCGGGAGCADRAGGWPAAPIARQMVGTGVWLPCPRCPAAV